MVAVAGRQRFLYALLGRNHAVGSFEVYALHLREVSLCDVRPCQLVVLVRQRVHRRYEDVQRRRVVETESLVRHNLQFGTHTGEVLRNLLYGVVGAHDDGYIRRVGAEFYQMVYCLDRLVQRDVGVVVLRKQLDVYVSGVLALVGHLLAHVGIRTLQLFGKLHVVLAAALLKVVELYLGGTLEESVVEVDDTARRTVVVRQRAYVEHVAHLRKLALDVVQHTPVARTPAVDALLHVAHNQVAVLFAVAHALLEQHLEVLPLHGARVLELVDHHVLQVRTNLLEDERRVGVLDERVE